MSKHFYMGNRLEYFRKKAGLTREELADLVDTTGTTIYRKERGKRSSLQEGELQLYSRVLGCRPEELVADVELIPIIGCILDGHVIMYSKDAKLKEIEAAVGTKASTVQAYDIKDNRNYPVYKEGDICIIDKNPSPPDECIDMDCLVVLEDNSKQLGLLNYGSKYGSYSLKPYNSSLVPELKIISVHLVDSVKRKRK